jgi:hypothetical protein
MAIKKWTCTKCGEEKELTAENYNRHNGNSRGYRPDCRVCMAKYKQEYYQRNKADILKRQQQDYESNPDKYRKRYQDNAEAHRTYARKYQKENKEICNERCREYYRNNKEQVKDRSKKYREENKETLAATRQAPHYRDRVNARQRKLRLDPQRRLSDAVSGAISKKIRDNDGFKGGATWQALPYTPQQLREHVESQFEDWMNWDNWGHGEGNWHVDHIYPQSKLPYDSLTHPNFLKCWALDNLRPLCAVENVRKSDKVITPYAKKDEES